MSNQNQSVNPDMLIVARESRGLSQQELATLLKVTQSRVSKMESGLLAVPDDLLGELSRILDYPRRFFLQSGPIAGVGMAELFHRKRQNVPKKILDQIYAEVEIRTRHIMSLLRAAEIPCNVRHVDIDDYDGHAEEIARLVRASWGIPRGPIQDLTQTIENEGVLVVPFDFHTRQVDAISRWVRNLPPIIFINHEMPKDRWRLTLAHELGHIIMHTVPTPDIEEQAFRFAAELLLPEQEVRSQLSSLNLPKAAQMKRYWKVSMAMIIKHAKDLGATTPNQDRYLWMQMAQAGYKTREPAELDVDGEHPTLLRELVDMHRKLGYSASDLADLLTLNPHELDLWYLRVPRPGGLRIIPGSLQSRA